MEKTIYIPGDLVMTNGIPVGTKKGIVYRVTESNADKYRALQDGNAFTELKGSVTLSNLKGKTVHDDGFLFCDSGAWAKDIVPIPLTPEILEKNGWKLEGATWIYKKGYIKVFRLLDNKTYAAYIFEARVFEFHFIHELQHLLFGLGLNSELEV